MYIVFTDIPDIVQDDQLEGTVKSILYGINVNLDVNDNEDCHRVGKSDLKTKSKKTNVRLVNRKYCKKALLNKKNTK